MTVRIARAIECRRFAPMPALQYARSQSVRSHSDRYRPAANCAAREPRRLLFEGYGRVDTELRAESAVHADADIFVTPRAPESRIKSFDASIRVASAYSTSAGLWMSMSSSTTITMIKIFERPECRENRVPLQSVVLLGWSCALGRRRGTGADRRPVISASDHDRHGPACSTLSKTRFEHVLAQHDGFATVPVDRMVDRMRARCVTAVISTIGAVADR